MTAGINTPFNRGSSQPNFISDVPSELSRSSQPIEIRIEVAKSGRRVNTRPPRPPRDGTRGAAGEPIQTGKQWARIDTLTLNQITYSPGPADDTMTLTWRPDPNKWKNADPDIDDEHYAQLLDLLKPDRLVQAFTKTGRSERRILFSGYPLPKTIQWSARDEALSVTCVSEGQIKARHGIKQQIIGRKLRRFAERDWDVSAQDLVDVTTLAPIFNANGKRNRSEDALVVPGTQGMFLFTSDDDPTAAYWSYADALRYVVYFYSFTAGKPIDVDDFLADSDEFVNEPHNATTKDPYIRDMTRRCDDDVSIQSTNLEEAIAVLVERAGLRFFISLIGNEDASGGFAPTFKLRVFGHLGDPKAIVDETAAQRKQVQPIVRDLPREQPFSIDPSLLSVREIAERSACDVLQLTIDDRPITRPKFLGGHKRYEGTFLLRPGWKPFNFLDDVKQTQGFVDSAVGFWKRRFNSEYFPGSGRRPRSNLHAEHWNHAEVADVFRLWIFPDSSDIDFAALGRVTAEKAAAEVEGTDDEAKRPWVWTEGRYKPKPAADDDDLGEGPSAYRDPLYGPGLPDRHVQWWAPRWRPFGPTIGRANPDTTDRKPIVRIHFGNIGSDRAILEEPGEPPLFDDEGWVTYMGNVEFDAQRAAIRFTEANIYNGQPLRAVPSDANALTAIWAYILQDFWVSITATIRSDSRMEHSPGGTKGEVSRAKTKGEVIRAKTIDLGFDRFQFANRFLAASNHLLGSEGRPPAFVESSPLYQSRDDREAFQAFGDRLAADMKVPVAAGVASFPFLCTEYQPGDVVSGSAGMNITLARRPAIERIIFTNVEGDVRTQLVLTDLRDVPESPS